MTFNPKSNDPTALFGAVIHSYTRAQALDDGVLIDVSAMAREAGFKWPVAVTQVVWQDCVAWTEADNRDQVYQDETGRLWDVLYMASQAIRTSRDNGSVLQFRLYRVARGSQVVKPQPTILKLVVGPGDQGEPVITIMLPGED